MADLSAEAWRHSFAGDHAGLPARPPWSREAASREGRRGVRFDSYSSTEFRLEAVERGLAEAQNGLRSVAGEVVGARAEMAELSRKMGRLPGRGFLVAVLLALVLAAAALLAAAPMLQEAARGWL